MTIENSESQGQQPKSIISYLWDLPNLLSLVGLGCTTLAIYFIILECLSGRDDRDDLGGRV